MSKMVSAHRRRNAGTRGTAALELALIAPLLAMMLAAVTDFSFAYHSQLQLAAALAAGAQYAFSQGQIESGPTLVNDVTAFVSSVSAVKLASVSSNYNNGLSATSCYCLQGSPATYTGPLVCGASCTDGSGSTAGKYLSITASFSYTAFFSVDQSFFNSSVGQAVTVRVK
jgi:Flp pilus assembly protein TadG